MAPSQVQVPRHASGPQPISFRFPVSWTYLAKPLRSPKTEEDSGHAPTSLPTNSRESISCAVVPSPAAVRTPPAKPQYSDSWEMVIPKADRPSARPSRVPRSSGPVAAAPSIPQNPPARVFVEASKMEAEADRGLQTLGGFSQQSRKPAVVAMKFAAPALLALVAAGFVYFKTTDTLPPASAGEAVEAGTLPVGLNGWITDNTWRSGSPWGRRISILRGSTKLTDFRLEFSGQLDSKALSWVFRVKDFKNFYVTRLEIIKPLPEAIGALTRFAVINGQEQPRVQVPLSMPIRPNVGYTIRLDAVGSSFTTWIQGQKVDQWTDAQIREGGIGLYSEIGDRNKLNGEFTVFPLFPKSQSRN